MTRLRPALIAVSAAALVVCGATLHGAYAAMNDRHNHAPMHRVYKLDYTLAVTEEGHAPKLINLMTSVEDEETSVINAGANIPLQVPALGALGAQGTPGYASPRQDVGLRVKSRTKHAGSDVLVHTDFEMSGSGDPRADGPVTIRKVVAAGDAVVTPGVPTTVATIEEPATHTRYELTVIASRVR